MNVQNPDKADIAPQIDLEACFMRLNNKITELTLLSNADALWTVKEVASYLRRSEKWVGLRSKDEDFPRSINVSGKLKPAPSGKAGRNGAPERLWRAKDIRDWVDKLAGN